MSNSYPIEIPESEPLKPTYPTKMSEVDRLRIENAFFKIEMTKSREEILKRDLIATAQLKQELQNQLLGLKDELLKTYDLDIVKESHRLQPDGTLLPKGTPASTMPPGLDQWALLNQQVLGKKPNGK